MLYLTKNAFKNFIVYSLLLFFFSCRISYCCDSYEKDNEEKLYKSISTGILRSGASLALEYPSEVILTRMQSNSTNSHSLRKVTKEIFLERGILGFYQGITPKISGIFMKNCYQWSILGLCPDFYRQILPNQFHDPLYSKILTGLTLGLTDVLLTPLERWKVHIITSPLGPRENLRDFLKKPQIFRELFRGSNAIFFASAATWINFLAIDHFTNLYMRNSENKNEVFLPQILFTTTVLVSFTETFLTLPFVMLQTQYQKAKNPMENTGILKGMMNIVKVGGVKRLYTGWRIDLFSTLVNSFFDVYFLNHLEHKTKK